jgi:hypothetical protein
LHASERERGRARRDDEPGHERDDQQHTTRHAAHTKPPRHAGCGVNVTSTAIVHRRGDASLIIVSSW